MVSKIIGLNFIIEYKKEVENSAVDSLSRREEPSQVLAPSSPIPHWVEPIKEEIAQDKELQDLVQRIQHGEAIGPWNYKSGLVFYKGQIYLRAQSRLTKAIIQELQS